MNRAYAELALTGEALSAQATATVRLVSGDDRVEELSRMLAGLPESDSINANSVEANSTKANSTKE